MSESKRYRGGIDYGARPEKRQSGRAQDRSDAYRDEPERTPFRARLGQIKVPLVRFVQSVDKAIPDVRTVDAMAYELARRTPRAIAVCIALLIAGIVGSRLNIWVEGFLWGIPSMGAISMGIGFWIWSTNVLMRRDLSPEARAVLQRAVRLQWSMIIAGALALIYFVGMALRFW